jgi:arabinofuranosyltransferase
MASSDQHQGPAGQHHAPAGQHHAPAGTAALPAVLVLGAAALLVWHSLRFNFVTDDAFISFVYARNLAEHGALVFNLGERVEGYTNFLWTLLLALGMKLHIAPELSSRVLGTLCAILTLGVVTRLSRRLRGADSYSPWDALPALLLAGIPGYACWASGGLETQLFTLFVTLGGAEYLETLLRDDPLAADRRHLARTALFFGLAALTRPEGFLFFALAGLHRLVLRIRARRFLPDRAELAAIGLFLLLTVPHLLWRRWYYGYWVPNTFYIKSSGGRAAWQQGAYYLFAFARDLKLFVLPALWALGLLRPLPPAEHRAYVRAGAFTLLCSAAFLLYVVSVGGDFMGLYRFVLPIVPLSVVCGSLGLLRLSRGAPAAALAPLALLFAHGVNTYFVDRHALGFIGADRGIDTPGYLRYYTEDRAAIGRWLGQHVQPDDYQVVGGAGAQVYYAGIRALDSFGLSDAYVAHEVPPVSIRPGHQKFAPLEYVLSRKPTILTYNVYRIGDEPYRPSPGEEAMWRARGFHYVSVQIPGLSRPFYTFLKRIDRRLGPLPPLTEQSP